MFYDQKQIEYPLFSRQVSSDFRFWLLKEFEGGRPTRHLDLQLVLKARCDMQHRLGISMFALTIKPRYVGT